MFQCFRGVSWARLFVKCSTTAEAAVAREDTEKARRLLNARLKDCEEEESRIEKKLMGMQTQLRLMAVNLETDAYPSILLHRIKAQVLEKNVVQRELEQIGALIGQLKRQQVVLKEAQLSTAVLLTLRKVLQRADPHIKKASSDSDVVLDELLEQRGVVADTSASLAQEFDYDDDEVDDTLPANDELDTDSELLLRQQALAVCIGQPATQGLRRRGYQLPCVPEEEPLYPQQSVPLKTPLSPVR